MSKLSAKKTLLLCLVVSLVLIVAGAFLFGFLGFNADSSSKDYMSVEVADNGSMVIDSEFRSSLEELCTSEIEGAGYKIGNVSYTSEASGGAGSLEFVLSGSVEEATLASFAQELDSALASASFGDSGSTFKDIGDISVTYHSDVYVPHYEYIWRTAIGAGVVLVLLFAYVAIRFKVGMGVTSVIAAAHNILLTLAVIALLRIPAGPAVICVALFALSLSMFFNVKVFGKMRQDFRLEDRQGLSAKEAVALSVRESRKGIFIGAILAASALVVLAVVGLIIGFDLFSFMLGALVAVIACTYSSLVLSPAIYTLIKEKSDAKRAERAKYNYASEKAAKKNAKQEG